MYQPIPPAGVPGLVVCSAERAPRPGAVTYRATISQTGRNTVRRTLPAAHPLNDTGRVQTEKFWVAEPCGPVRRLHSLVDDASWEEVCKRLERPPVWFGRTLMATPATLLAVIRREHSAAMQAHRAACPPRSR